MIQKSFEKWQNNDNIMMVIDMLFRKIEKEIREYLQSDNDRIWLINGARQIGKTYIIRHACKNVFKNYIEINMQEDKDGPQYFASIKSGEDFYFQLSSLFGNKLNSNKDTVIFIDEIQAYKHLFPLLKTLRKDNKYKYIASGSLLGVELAKSSFIPMGSIEIVEMYPLDFEEFILANNCSNEMISMLKENFDNLKTPTESIHRRMMDLFKRYLLVGGLPAAVNQYLENQNLVDIRKIHKDIYEFYKADASKYDEENKLVIRKVYDLIPSCMGNKKKRINIKDIEEKKGAKAKKYEYEFEYLINSGIAIEVKAISNPHFPLLESESKDLLKLYLNDVGILTSVLYGSTPRPVLDDASSINLGSVYESVVAQELKAHGIKLYYYDNKNYGEVDFLLNDYDNLSILPIEVKSGKDYTIHHALNTFIKNDNYHVKRAYVLSNENKITKKDCVIYLPIYFVMFINYKKEKMIKI